LRITKVSYCREFPALLAPPSAALGDLVSSPKEAVWFWKPNIEEESLGNTSDFRLKGRNRRRVRVSNKAAFLDAT
jgi:hypothetical protein